MLAQATYAAVARAIAAFEPVLVIADAGEGGDARAYCGSDNIEVVELPIDDSWVRDSGPIFLVGPEGELAAADFLFNSWGERYLPYDKDAEIGARLCEHPRRAALRRADRARGRRDHRRRRGHAHHDRELPAEPESQPAAVEGRDRAGPQGLPRRREGHLARVGLARDDPDTDGHVDGVAAFIGPARVVLCTMVARPRAPRLRQPAGEQAPARDDRRAGPTARGRRVRSAGATGRRRRQEHRRRLRQLLPGERGAGRADGRHGEPTSTRSSDSAEIVPEREVVGVPTPVLGYGGGGIHCITQQVPAASRVSLPPGS